MLDPRRSGETDRPQELEQLLMGAYGLARPCEIPRKLGLPPADWAGLLALLATGDCQGFAPATALARAYRACYHVGLADRFLAILTGVTFPLAAAGVAWSRRIGVRAAAPDALHQALTKLRFERQGLVLQRWVDIAGQPVDWAIAGLLPTGEPLRLAVVIRPEPRSLTDPTALSEALATDLADDEVAGTGFTLLAFRTWQLRYPAACALQVGACCTRLAPYMRLPSRLAARGEDIPVHRGQATPALLTPREQGPRWALREELRRDHPGADDATFLARYMARVREAGEQD